MTNDITYGRKVLSNSSPLRQPVNTRSAGFKEALMKALDEDEKEEESDG